MITISSSSSMMILFSIFAWLTCNSFLCKCTLLQFKSLDNAGVFFFLSMFYRGRLWLSKRVRVLSDASKSWMKSLCHQRVVKAAVSSSSSDSNIESCGLMRFAGLKPLMIPSVVADPLLECSTVYKCSLLAQCLPLLGNCRAKWV